MRYFLVFLASILFATHALCDPEHDARELNFEIMSPFCPGRALADCPTSSADELRNEIRARLDSGETKASILEDVIKKYGEQFRAAPKNEGFGIFAYFIPALLFLLGLVFIVFFVVKSKKQVNNN